MAEIMEVIDRIPDEFVCIHGENGENRILAYYINPRSKEFIFEQLCPIYMIFKYDSLVSALLIHDKDGLGFYYNNDWLF